MGRVKELVEGLIRNDTFRKFVRFAIVGASGMVVDYGVLALCHELIGLKVLVSNTISFIAAATSNYFLNRIWTFKSKERQVGVEYLKFFAVSLVGLGISNLTLLLLGQALPEWYADRRVYLLKFVAIVVTTIWNFFGNMLFTFKQRRD